MQIVCDYTQPLKKVQVAYSANMWNKCYVWLKHHCKLHHSMNSLRRKQQQAIEHGTGSAGFATFNWSWELKPGDGHRTQQLES